MRTIPQRELRNRISEVLRQVEAGDRLQVTVDGRPVAYLLPIARRRQFVPRDELRRILTRAALDPAITVDIEVAAGATLDEL